MEAFLRTLKALPRQERAYDLGRFRVLLVEDSSFILGLLSSCLMQMGVGEIVRAQSCAAAIQKLSAHNGTGSLSNIDLVLLDWLMPGGDGWQVLKWMRSHKRDAIRFLPVIVCSAFTDASVVTESRDLGANEVMVKPVSAEKVAHRILRIIDFPRPYVQAPLFFGPDRRRQLKKRKGDERRSLEPDIVVEQDE